jgi:hypothetical protein
MLAVPINFWALEGSEDDFLSNLLMVSIVHAIAQHYPPVIPYRSTLLKSTIAYKFVHEHVLFRPPLVTQN